MCRWLTSPKMRSDVVLQGQCDMPIDTPVVNRYERDERYPSNEERGWRKLPDPIGYALLMVMFRIETASDGVKLVEQAGGLHEGKSRCGFSVKDLNAVWKLLDHDGSVDVCIVARPRFANIVADGSAELFGPDRGHWPGDKVRSRIYTLSKNEHGEFLIDGKAAPKPSDPGPTAEEQAAIEASDRQMREERLAHEQREQAIKDEAARSNREANERIERERKEAEEQSRKDSEDADKRIEQEREAQQREKERAAKERAKLGIKETDDRDATSKLTDASPEDDDYLILLNLWSSQYAAYGNAGDDVDGFMQHLKEFRDKGQFTDAIDEMCRRLDRVL